MALPKLATDKERFALLHHVRFANHNTSLLGIINRPYGWIKRSEWREICSLSRDMAINYQYPDNQPIAVLAQFLQETPPFWDLLYRKER
jgi:hypothetical protein